MFDSYIVIINQFWEQSNIPYPEMELLESQLPVHLVQPMVVYMHDQNERL